MTATMSHDHLVTRAAAWLRHRIRCYIILAEPWGADDEIPDAIGWCFSPLSSTLIECKASKADFFADRTKKHRSILCDEALGTFRYYLTPKGLVRPQEVPLTWGLLEATDHTIRTVRKAPRWPMKGEGRLATRYRNEVKILLAAMKRHERQMSAPLLPSETAP